MQLLLYSEVKYVPVKETKCLKLLWKKLLKCADPNPYYQRKLYQVIAILPVDKERKKGILLTERFPRLGSTVVKGIVKEYVL